MKPLACSSSFSVLLLVACAGTREGREDSSSPRSRAPDPREVPLEVVNHSGEIVADSAATLRKRGEPFFRREWTSADAGRIVLRLQDEDEAGTYEILVRAPGHPPQRMRLDVPVPDATRIVLSEGRRVELVLTPEDGRELPQPLRPVVFDSELGADAWLSVQPEMDVFMTFPVEKDGAGNFVFSAPTDARELFVLVHEPGFLRAFQAGPLTPAMLETGRLEVVLPAPGSVRCQFGPPPDRKEPPYSACGVEVGRFHDLPNAESWYFALAREEHSNTGFLASWNDLAPGHYAFEVFTGTAATREDRTRPGAFEDRKDLEIQSGTKHELTFQFAEFDAQKIEGEYALRLSVTRFSGEPVAGAPFALSYYDPQFGPKTVREGTLSEQGWTEISGLPGGERALEFDLAIDGQSLASIALEGAELTREVSVRMPPDVGDVVPEHEMIDVASGATVKLSDFGGRVLLLDFWASWCGPCQGPMAENDALVRRRTDWESRVAMLGLSIDADLETIRAHVERTGWNAVRQLFCGEGAWESAPARTFGIRAVPTALLVDSSGKIVWRGHPASIDLEARIDELVASE